MIDEPIMYFTAQAQSSDLIGHKEAVVERQSEIGDFDGDLKIHLLPLGHLSIQIRLQNLADLFDGTPETTPMFDLLSYAQGLFKQANPSVAESDFSISVRERTLSNSMDYSKWADQKIHWKTVEDSTKNGEISYPEDREKDAVIALQPQRIRLFQVDFKMLTDATSLFLE